MKHATLIRAAFCGTLATFALSQAPAAQAMTILVNAVTDTGSLDGNCELREAVHAANSNHTIDGCVHDGSDGFDTIAFDYNIGWPATITLTGGEIYIYDEVQIAGPGASNLSVSGNFNSRIFAVLASSGIAGLTLWRGSAENSWGGGDARGGAIFTMANELVIDGVTFFSNKAKAADGSGSAEGGNAFGGAIYGDSAASNIFVKNSLFLNNFAEGGAGGSTGDGGAGMGAAVWAQGELTLVNTTVTGNGSYGGDAGSELQYAGTATGAIDSRQDLRLTHVTVYNNEAKSGQVGTFQTEFGGGVYLQGDGEIEYSIVAGNSADQGPDIGHLTANLASNGHNVLGIEPFLFEAAGDVFGTAASPVDPLLAALADNGGQTMTLALQAGSPALDIDSAAACVETADQRHVDRPQGSGCDAGAFELEVQEPAPFCPAEQGFWKNNPDLWPENTMTLGNEPYDQAELLAILDNPSKKDASVIMAKQLIAARLNVAAGADATAVADDMLAADGLLPAFVGKLPYYVKTNSLTGKQMTKYGKILESFNKQELNPECAQ
jgi:hypothetical protein